MPSREPIHRPRPRSYHKAQMLSARVAAAAGGQRSLGDHRPGTRRTTPWALVPTHSRPCSSSARGRDGFLRQTAVVVDAIGVEAEGVTVVALQAALRGHPDIAGAVLQQGVDRVLRRAVLAAEMVEVVAPRCARCRRRQARQEAGRDQRDPADDARDAAGSGAFHSCPESAAPGGIAPAPQGARPAACPRPVQPLQNARHAGPPARQRHLPAELGAALAGLRCSVGASDLHGSLTGFLCGGGVATSSTWLQRLAFAGGDRRLGAEPLLQRLFQECCAQLGDAQLGFEPCCPMPNSRWRCAPRRWWSGAAAFGGLGLAGWMPPGALRRRGGDPARPRHHRRFAVRLRRRRGGRVLLTEIVEFCAWPCCCCTPSCRARRRGVPRCIDDRPGRVRPPPSPADAPGGPRGHRRRARRPGAPAQQRRHLSLPAGQRFPLPVRVSRAGCGAGPGARAAPRRDHPVLPRARSRARGLGTGRASDRRMRSRATAWTTPSRSRTSTTSCPASSKGAERVHYHFGRDSEFDLRLIGWVKRVQALRGPDARTPRNSSPCRTCCTTCVCTSRAGSWR